jgi:hypothetical protein
MDQENVIDQNLQSSGLNQEIERSEGNPSWDEVYEPEEMDLDKPSTYGDDQEEPHEIDIDDDAKNEILDREEQKNTPQESSNRVLKFSDYFNRSQ